MITLRMSRRRQPILQGSNRGGPCLPAGTHLGEAVGGAAAVCCCCTCGLANIIFLVVYKLPASLCRRALQKQRQRQRLASKEGMHPVKSRGCSCGCGDDFGVRIHPDGGDVEEVVKRVKGLEEEEQDKDVVELEKEMWERFYSTGFWRSCSRRKEDSSSSSSKRIFSIVSVSN